VANEASRPNPLNADLVQRIIVTTMLEGLTAPFIFLAIGFLQPITLPAQSCDGLTRMSLVNTSHVEAWTITSGTVRERKREDLVLVAKSTAKGINHRAVGDGTSPSTTAHREELAVPIRLREPDLDSNLRIRWRFLFIGPTGIGKSWLACALAHRACRDGFSALHKRTTELFRELAVAHIDGSIGRVLLKLSRVDVLVLDDFAMAPLKDSERRDFLEICDDRYQRRSLILTSQMPIAHWHEQIGDPTIADSILDRLVHNAYRIELSGESMRKKRGRKSDEGAA
jgi:hypothetical protein